MKNNNIKPILFSTPMVQANLRGQKTQTRRIIKYSKKITDPEIGFSMFTEKGDFSVRGIHENGEYGESFFKQPYKIGDILWVREEHYRLGKWIKNGFSRLGNQKWRFIALTNEVKYCDNPPEKFRISRDKKNSESQFWYKRLARFMPKEAARIFLKLKGIRV
jgi:hypothetical protein